MVSNSTINQIANTGEKYIEAYNDLVKSSWQNHCGCHKPGLQAKCITCPFGIEFIQKIQREIDPDSKLGMIEIRLPQAKKPYSSEFKQICALMHQSGCSLAQIQKLTGIKYIAELRFLLLRAGIYKNAEDYSQKQKQQCIDLYLSGLTPLEIEEKTRISGLVISDWIYSSKLPPRSKRIRPSKKQCKLALEMYIAGESYAKIKSVTSVSSCKVKKMAEKQNVQRKKQPKGSGRPTVYSSKFRQTCLKLLAEGKTPIQVEQLMGVSAGHVRSWQRDYIT